MGAAFVDVLGLSGQTIACGGDMRPSSPGFSLAFAAGAARRGADVKSLGLISTDELYYVCGALDMAGAIFTASHTPAASNGIKMGQAGPLPVPLGAGLPSGSVRLVEDKEVQPVALSRHEVVEVLEEPLSRRRPMPRHLAHGLRERP